MVNSDDFIFEVADKVVKYQKRERDRSNIDEGITRELLEEPNLDRNQIIFFLERFKNGDTEDEAYRILLVDTFLNSVFLYDDDRLVLVMNYSGEKAVTNGDVVSSGIALPPAPSLIGSIDEFIKNHAPDSIN